MVELCKRSIELQASNSTVLHAGRTYRLLIGTPTHDTTLTFSYGQVNERYVAFYPDGSPAFKEERGKRGYSRTWYYEDGQVRDHDPLDLVGKHRIARIRTAFFRDGRRDELVILNDTDDYYLDLDKDGHTTLYSFTDLRKGASPYRVVISSACGKRKQVRLYTTRKGRYAYQYFEQWVRGLRGLRKSGDRALNVALWKLTDLVDQRPFNNSRAFSTAALVVFLPLSI